MRRSCFTSLLGPIVALALVGAMGSSFAKTRASTTTSAIVVQTCDWNRPGHNPFMGDVVAAVDRYQDIPTDARQRLKARMVKRAYDDVVTIRRDSIQGKARYGKTIRDMHFGNDRVCRSVTRSAWSLQMQERGLVYCDGGDCVLVPTVCRNVSRISRAQVADERAEGDEAPLDVAPMAPDGVVPVGLETDLPSGLPGLDSQAAAASSFITGGASFAFGGVTGESGEFGSATSGPAGIASRGAGVGITAAPVVGGPWLSAAVAAVPEPETWCLLLCGLGTLGAISRRRARLR